MESKNNSIYKSAMTSGLVLGILQTILILIVYLMGFDIIRPPFLMTLLNYIITIGGIIYSTRKYRYDLLDDEISYSKALGFGILVCVFAGIIFGLYMVIHMHYIDTEYLTKLISVIEEEYNKMGFSAKQIEDSIKVIGLLQKPILMVAFTVIGSSFMGLFFSLVTSAFLKKEKSIL